MPTTSQTPSIHIVCASMIIFLVWKNITFSLDANARMKYKEKKHYSTYSCALDFWDRYYHALSNGSKNGIVT